MVIWALASVFFVGCGYQLIEPNQHTRLSHTCIGQVQVVAPDGLAVARLETHIRRSFAAHSNECESTLDFQIRIITDHPAGLNSSGKMTIGVVRAVVVVKGNDADGHHWTIQDRAVARGIPLGGSFEDELMALRESFVVTGRAAIDNAVRTVAIRMQKAGNRTR